MHQAMVVVTRGRADALAVKTREERSRAGPIEAFVVVEDAKPQSLRFPSNQQSEKLKEPELLSIKGAAESVKAARLNAGRMD
jgi:hypothetical protein